MFHTSICISTLQKPCFYLFSHWNPHRTPRVLTPTTASLDALVHAPLRHKRTCGRSTAESFLKKNNPSMWQRWIPQFVPHRETLKNICYEQCVNGMIIIYIYRWLLRNTKDIQKASPEKKHVSQETGLDGTWSEELAPNALTWTQKNPQLNEPMHGTSLQITCKI